MLFYSKTLRLHIADISREHKRRRLLPAVVSQLVSVSKFFSRIMATHSIPKIWKKAKVIAIKKPGKDPSLAANHSPISLLSVCYKLLERLALQHISPTVERLLSPDQAGFRKGRSTCDQVAVTTFIENGFQQNLKTGTLVFFTNWVKACHIGSPDWWVCCFEIDVSGCTWAMTPVLGDPNVTAFLNTLPLHRFCSTCTPMTCQLHVAENSSMLTTYVSPFKANTSANWNVVSCQVCRGCHTSVDSGDLNQAPPKQSAVCSTCITPAPPVNCQFIWMASAFSMSATQPILGWL